MDSHLLLNIGLAFVEGFGLIISPCILPILPVILASSLSGSKKRPLGIICGFAITFTLFSYFAHALVQYTGINLGFIRHAAYFILTAFGLVLLSTYLSECFTQTTSRLSEVGQNVLSARSQRQDFFSGLWIGALISLLWTPCAGPILAAVIVQIATQKESINSLFLLFSFAMGVGIPMFVIAFYSVKLKDSFLFFNKHAVFFRKGLGLIIILNVLLMMASEYKGFTLRSISHSDLKAKNYLQNALWLPYKAPPIAGIAEWINSAPIELSSLKGKVVLLDFWTFSCINCIRTIPYMNYWYNQYKSLGLEIIGVHSPEFAFEKDIANIKNAVKQNHIEYPVAIDNHFVTWNNYENHYWPAHYLIDKEGNVVYEHFGEGSDDIIENNIRYLLGKDYSTKTANFHNEPQNRSQTPETYLGFGRAQSNANNELQHDKTTVYQFPAELKNNQWALQGKWTVTENRIISAEENASIKIHFNAKTVFMVMGNENKPNQLSIKLNNSKESKELPVRRHSLYTVLSLPQFSQGTLEITAALPGLEVYTFTFGD